MRRLVLAGLGTVSSLVLIFAYPTSHNADAAGTTSSTTITQASSSSGGSDGDSDDQGGVSDDDEDDGGTVAAAPSQGSGSSSSGSSSGTAAAKTYTGSAADTQYGPVQVQITVANGKITAAEAVQYPNNDGHSQRINSFAIPTLNSEVVAAQSAQIDAVSGATITSNAYLTSVQSALDAAGL